MFRPRIIPVLLLKNNGLVKSVKFSNYRYIGDPINAVKIFNDLHADELVFLDITATAEKRSIPLELIKDIAEEANMPFCVGGGIRTINNIQQILTLGAEKVVICSHAAENPDFVKEAADSFGSSTITVCIDVRKTLLGKEQIWIHGGTKSLDIELIEFAQLMQEKGAGEIIIQSINHDGTMKGYDIDLIKRVSAALTIPIVALGGAGSLEHMKKAYEEGHANGLGAGSLFIYQGPRHGVLINYPEKKDTWFA